MYRLIAYQIINSTADKNYLRYFFNDQNFCIKPIAKANSQYFVSLLTLLFFTSFYLPIFAVRIAPDYASFIQQHRNRFCLQNE
jgi:hypothetical protein